MIPHSKVEQIKTMCRVTFSDFPLMVSDAISCPLHNLKTLWYITMIIYSYVEQGPVVQSIVSLTSSLRGQLVKCFTTL